MNPDLLDPMNPQQVPPLNVITKPMGTTLLKEYKCFHCTVPNASTHRADGKKLAFVHNFLRTNIAQDIAHLEHEIAEGNQYFRPATEQEIEQYDMRTDPRGTLTKSIHAELVPQIRAEVEQELRATLEAQIRAELSGAKEKTQLPDEKTPAQVAMQNRAEATANSNADAAKLAGSDIRSRVKPADVVQTQGATLTHQNNKPPFTPVSTTDIAAGAPTSGK